jgi:hypothetical protein
MERLREKMKGFFFTSKIKENLGYKIRYFCVVFFVCLMIFVMFSGFLSLLMSRQNEAGNVGEATAAAAAAAATPATDRQAKAADFKEEEDQADVLLEDLNEDGSTVLLVGNNQNGGGNASRLRPRCVVVVRTANGGHAVPADDVLIEAAAPPSTAVTSV